MPVFSANGNGLSDLHGNCCAKSEQWGLLAHQFLSKSDKPFPRYCRRKLAEKSEIFLGHPLGAEGPCRAKRELSREARVSRRQAELPGARSAPDEARIN